MARKSNTDLMFEFVEDYLNGNMERMFFDLDFDYYFIKYYPSMERRNAAMAECFAYYLSEAGIDCSEGLSDDAHKALIQRQWDAFHEALHDGM